MAGEAGAAAGGAATGGAGAGAGAGTSSGAAGGSGAAAAGAGTAAPAAGTSTNTAPPAAGTTTTTAPDWMTGFNDDHKGFVQNKGWKAPTEMVDSYRNLEKLVGAPQNEIIRLAKDDDAAGWESIYSRLGRPSTPDGYKLEAPKEGGGGPEFAKWASEQFYKAGLSEKQGKSVVEAWNKYVQDQITTEKTTYTNKITEETTALKKEWGAAYDQNMSAAKRAAREFGIEATVIDAIEKGAGFAKTMKLFQTLGSKLGDASFVRGNGGSTNADGPMTPAQAQDQIKGLKADPGFTAKYVAGDQGARQKMEMLHKYAYPDA